jgi:hypothetical protein
MIARPNPKAAMEKKIFEKWIRGAATRRFSFTHFLCLVRWHGPMNGWKSGAMSLCVVSQGHGWRFACSPANNNDAGEHGTRQ